MQEEIYNRAETLTHLVSIVLYTLDMHVMGSKCVLMTKLNAYGSLDKLKAILVAKGFGQEKEIDYLETYSPVARITMARLILHVASVME